MEQAALATPHRTLGRVSCWGTFVLGLVYTAVAVLTVLYNVDPATARAPFLDPYRPVASMLLIPIAALMIASMAAVHAYAPPELKGYSLLSLVFMGLAMGATSVINFAFFVVLTHPAETADAPWLSLFLPHRRPGVVGSMDLMVWGWLFSLSMIAAAPVFRRGRLEKALRILMLATGVLSIAGWLIMVLVPSAWLPGLVMQILGWGVLILVVWFLLARVFDRATVSRGQANE